MSVQEPPVELARSVVYDDTSMEVYKTVEELRENLNKRKRTTSLVDNFSNIKFSNDVNGKLQIDFGSGKQAFSSVGFDRFCKLIRVPSKFVKTLPYDNIEKDLYVSLFKSPLEQINFISKDNRVIGVSDKEDPVSTSEIVDKLFETNHKTIRDVSVYNEQLILSFTRNEEAPIIGDRIDSGLCLSHDDSTGGNPSLSYYFWREVCTNGAVAREIQKIAKFSKRMGKTQMFEIFNARVEESLNNISAILSGAIQTMNNTKIIQDEKKYLKCFLDKKLNFEENEVIGTAFTKSILQNVDSSYYDLMNFITDSAKSFPIDEKFHLESLGGNMVAHFKSVHPSFDIFKGYNDFKRKKMHKDGVVV